MRYFKMLMKPEIVFFILAMFCFSFAAIYSPAGGSNDEPSHIARADQILRGELLPVKVDRKDVNTDYIVVFEGGELYGGEADEALIYVSVCNLRSFQGSQDKYEFPTWKDPDIQSSEKLGKSTVTFAFSNSSVNNPIVYLPYVLGDAVARQFTDNAYAVIVAMRLFGVLFFCISISACIHFIPVGKWILATVSLLPSAAGTMSSVTGDTFTYVSLCFLMTVFFIVLDSEKLGKRQYILLAMASALVAMGKITYFPFVMLLFVIPIVRKDFRNAAALKCLSGIFVLSILIFLAWYIQVNDINTSLVLRDSVDPQKQLAFMLENPTVFIRAFIKNILNQNIFNIGPFGTTGVHSDFEHYGWWSVIGLIAAVLVKDSREKRRAEIIREKKCSFVITVLIIIVGIVGLIEVALYLQFTPVGRDIIDGVQDRYWLPVLPLLLICLELVFGEAGEQRGTRLVLNNNNIIPGRVYCMAVLQVIMAVLMIVEFSRSLFGSMWVFK